jgi:hypothetical protein
VAAPKPAPDANPLLVLASQVRSLFAQRRDAVARLTALQMSSINSDRVKRRLHEPTRRRTHWDALLGEW